MQALEVNKETNSDLNDKGVTQTSDKEKNVTTDMKLSSLEENDPVAEDVAFMEKYLAQQMKGQKPDGADGKKVVYLTFDDGPSETVTPKMLDALKAENVHATFFVVGKNVAK